MSCSLPIVYNDDRWSTIESLDQLGCDMQLARLLEHDLKTEKTLLHVGIGISSTARLFDGVFSTIHGISVTDSELKMAREIAPLLSCNYEVIKMNKYNAESFNTPFLLDKYDYIIDNNLKQHACCEEHWTKYLYNLLKKMNESSVLITHTRGFSSHTNLICNLSIEELEVLVEDTGFLIGSNPNLEIGKNYPVLVIQKTL